MINDVAIIGAGLTGLACALQFAQRNFHISVYERRSRQEITAPKYEIGGKAGRSMSMDLSARGLFTLRELNLFEQVQKNSVPMKNKIFHKNNHNKIIIPYGPTHQENILTISRTELYNILLKSCLDFSNIKINFSSRLAEIDFSTRTAGIYDTRKHNTSHIAPSLIIGADGVNSKVRSFLTSKGNIKFNKVPFPHCYKELTISPNKALQLEPQAMHLWSRSEYMLVAQPNFNKSFTCALILKPNGSHPSFQSIDKTRSIRTFFDTNFPDASPLMPQLEQEYAHNPVCPLIILQGSRWAYDNFALVMGDAAHGMVPFFGQGVNCCLEDTTLLANYLDKYENNVSRAISAFNNSRVQDANAICTMSYENYPELFPHNNTEKLLLEKQVEVYLAKTYGDRFRTYHNLVCFDRVPYSYAQQIKLLQTNFIKKITSNIKNIDQINSYLINQEFKIYQQKLNNIQSH